MTDATGLVWAIAWPPAYALICAAISYARHKPPWKGLGESWAIGAIGVLLGQLPVFGGHFTWLQTLIGSAHLAIGLWLHWRKRRKRRHAAQLLGAKSRALRDAMVRKVRETARPRRVLRPVPQGAWLVRS